MRTISYTRLFVASLRVSYASAIAWNIVCAFSTLLTFLSGCHFLSSAAKEYVHTYACILLDTLSEWYARALYVHSYAVRDKWVLV